MPFNNPILAGEELIRSAMRSDDFTEGTEGPATGWKIDRNGDAFFANLESSGDAEGPSAAYDSVSANTSFLYKGDELSVLLDRVSQPFVAFGQYNAGLADPITTSEVAFLELSASLVAGRQYVLGTTLIQITGSSNAGIVIRYTTDGTQPTLTSPILRYETISAADRFVQIIEPMFPPTATYRFLMTLITFTGTSTKALKGDAASPEISIWVQDHGTAVQNTGISNPLSAPPASKTYREFDVAAYAIRSFDSNFTPSPSPDNTTKSYQGKVPGVNSVRTGWSFFDVGAGGLIKDIFGVPAADVVYLEAYLFYPHWYFSSGGTCVLGWHTTTAVPNGNEPGGGVVDVKQQSYPGRNIGQWINILGNPIGDRVLDGTFGGFITGRHDQGNDLIFYGYATEIRLRAGYYK